MGFEKDTKVRPDVTQKKRVLPSSPNILKKALVCLFCKPP